MKVTAICREMKQYVEDKIWDDAFWEDLSSLCDILDPLAKVTMAIQVAQCMWQCARLPHALSQCLTCSAEQFKLPG